MKEQLIIALKKKVEEGLKKGILEELIGIPKNSLSAVLNGTRVMPDSWIPKIEGYLKTDKEMDKVLDELNNMEPIPEVPESEIPIPEPITPRTQLVVEKSGLKEKPSPQVKSKLDDVMDKINKDFGAGTVMTLRQKGNVAVESVSTGSIGLDLALGVGGLPRGRVVEIYGPESVGKSSLCIHVMAEAQKKGLKCAIIDTEHAFDPDYAANLGVNIDELFICQPDYGEQGLEVADKLISSGEIGVIVIDSVAALTPKAELDDPMGTAKMGLHARLMSQALRKLTAVISRTNTICIFTNQLREKIGVVYGNPETQPGGRALAFYASVRLDMRRSAQIKDGDVSLGNRIKVKVIKNKVAPPFKTAEFDIIFGEGINRVGELIDMGVELNIINKSGSWYSYGAEKLGQGKESVRELLLSNPDFAKEIETKVLNAIKSIK